MPSPDLLDIAALTAPIPGDDPAGDTKDFYTLRRTLDECRTEHDPEQYPQGTPEREQPKREPNWVKIQQETKEALGKRCKHILYAVRLAEALVMQSGFAGVRDGMKLLKQLVAECWDRLHPKIEEPGDEAARIAQLNWLGDPVSGAFYPTKIRKTPMFGAMSWQNWKDASGNFEAAVSATPLEKCQLMVEDIAAAQEELRGLLAVTDEKSPSESAELGEVSRALQDCIMLVQQVVQKKGGGVAADAGGDSAEAGGGESSSGGSGAVRAGASRDQIYQELNRLADVLSSVDRHSPVPLLLKKIVQLGPMSFHQLVEELTREQKIVDFFRPAEGSAATGGEGSSSGGGGGW